MKEELSLFPIHMTPLFDCNPLIAHGMSSEEVRKRLAQADSGQDVKLVAQDVLISASLGLYCTCLLPLTFLAIYHHRTQFNDA